MTEISNPFSVATFNVNSISARLPNLLEWLDNTSVDIVLLQELKCMNEKFPAMEIEERGYNLAIHGQKTYNGVAILSKFPLSDIMTTIDGNEDDPQSRYIEAVASLPGKAVRVASVYVPNGQEVGSDKFVYKLGFLEKLRAHWQTRLAYREEAVLGGDFNCAPDPVDVYDASRLDGSVCYHHEERTRMRALLNLGMYDAWRMLNPTKQQFSWWDYRGDGYGRGHGLRIDHILTSPHATDQLRSCVIDENPRAKERPSDHAPVIATFAA